MTRWVLPLIILAATSGCDMPSEQDADSADLVLRNAKVWTGEASAPWADWVAVRGDRIAAVGQPGDQAPEAKRTIDLGGRLLVPGFNDSHVHFAQAGALLLGVNLLDVNDDAGFRQRIAEATARLPEGSWITGGDWGAYEAWEMGSDGTRRAETAFAPTRSLIDGISPSHPVLVTRYDRAVGLANALALAELGMVSETGMLEGEQLRQALAAVPDKSFERLLAESRRALDECRRWGVTSVQDISPRSQLDVYARLREAGELSCRIHYSPSRLPEYERMIQDGWVVGAGDEWVRFGTIKTHIDGIMGGRSARFFDPYDDNPPGEADWRGGWREFSGDLREFERMLTAADAANIQLRVHAIGDEANSILLDMLERLEQGNGVRDRRLRIVHAQVVHPDDLPRFAEHSIIAEVQPYHCTDDMRWMEERIGHERSKGAYAFRSLADAGADLVFGSDWPGTNASYYPVNPLYGLYAAVTRQTLEGTPPTGWFPEEKITLEEALRAYTWGGSFASFEEQIKGTISPGKLADLAVLDVDLFNEPPARWLEAHVDYTIVGGEIVWDRAGEAS
jgi:predicted amidohydrolase YtcJ